MILHPVVAAHTRLVFLLVTAPLNGHLEPWRYINGFIIITSQLGMM